MCGNAPRKNEVVYSGGPTAKPAPVNLASPKFRPGTETQKRRALISRSLRSTPITLVRRSPVMSNPPGFRDQQDPGFSYLAQARRDRLSRLTYSLSEFHAEREGRGSDAPSPGFSRRDADMSSLSICAQPEADVWPLITFVQLKNPTLLNRSPAMTTTPR